MTAPLNNAMNDEASYLCDSCGEEIVVPIDLSAGASQEYVEDCPVCCCPNIVHVEVDEDDDVRVWATKDGRRVSVFKIAPTTGERRGILATVGEGGWIDLPQPIIVKAGDAFIAVPEPSSQVTTSFVPTKGDQLWI